mmetsp:Transcript_17274/g.26925  ORF Transcript_17274/g.26925 Transcript_17274/m.26925 type:complete len:133 (+) Transcript_17274:191-589(+)
MIGNVMSKGFEEESVVIVRLKSLPSRKTTRISPPVRQKNFLFHLAVSRSCFHFPRPAQIQSDSLDRAYYFNRYRLFHEYFEMYDFMKLDVVLARFIGLSIGHIRRFLMKTNQVSLLLNSNQFLGVHYNVSSQ